MWRWCSTGITEAINCIYNNCSQLMLQIIALLVKFNHFRCGFREPKTWWWMNYRGVYDELRRLTARAVLVPLFGRHFGARMRRIDLPIMTISVSYLVTYCPRLSYCGSKCDSPVPPLAPLFCRIPRCDQQTRRPSTILLVTSCRPTRGRTGVVLNVSNSPQHCYKQYFYC